MNHRPINTALLAYGMSGELFHAPFLAAHPGFHFTKVVERKRQKAGERYPDVKSVSNNNDVFHDSDIELVVVNTPNDTHCAFAKEALLADKHVVVEKPFTVTTAEADELIALAKKKNRILTVFQSRRFDGDFKTLQSVVKQKLVGKIVEFEAHYDRFRNYIESNTWKEVATPGTGILYNLGAHMLDQVLVLFGKPDMVDARIGAHRPGGTIDDFYDIRLMYDDLLVIVKSSYLVREQGPRYALHGVQGSFVKYGIDPQEEELKKGVAPGSANWGNEGEPWWGKLNVVHNGVDEEKKIETLPGNYMEFYNNLYDAIRNDGALAITAEQAKEVIRLIEIGYQSNLLQKAMKF